MRSTASVESPAMLKFTSAAWPSSETALSPRSGDFTFSTYRIFARRPATSATAALKAASLTVSSSLWTSTTSSCGRSPASWSATSALWDSPLKLSTSEMDFDPSAVPIASARTANASQPQKAFFRCLLLHRAMRAARLCEDRCESIGVLSDYVGRSRRAWPDAGNRLGRSTLLGLVRLAQERPCRLLEDAPPGGRLLALLVELLHDLPHAGGRDVDAVLGADRLELVIVLGQLQSHRLEPVAGDLHATGEVEDVR